MDTKTERFYTYITTRWFRKLNCLIGTILLLSATPLSLAQNLENTDQLLNVAMQGIKAPNTFNLPINAPNKVTYSNHIWHKRINRILSEHWQPSPHDPLNTSNDIAKMAKYFSQYPQVRLLFSKLEHSNWKLQYAAKTYKTKIHGNRLNVDSATVYFDPRSAAQFKFYKACTKKTPHCIASPADVLLHELLHVHAAINHSEEFLTQGGMNNLMYPYEHERLTILAEKQLYHSMTKVDGQPRPLRNEHSGRHILAACVTCLK